jgi:hypothetical protein
MQDIALTMNGKRINCSLDEALLHACCMVGCTAYQIEDDNLAAVL